MEFEEFWREYPRKVGRIKAERAWWKLREMDKGRCIEGLRKWTASGDWTDIQFVPYPATFLNQKRFLEEPTFPAVFRVARPAKDYIGVGERRLLQNTLRKVGE